LDSKYIEKKYVKEKTIEKREYQNNISDIVKSKNSIVVLPTGLGKTVVALLAIADSMISNPKKSCIILAPTRVLVHQHYKFLSNSLALDPTEISVITGEDVIEKRKKKWQNQIVCATPQILKLDIIRSLVNLEQFSIVIFDEAHRTVGNYAYVFIAKEVSSINPDARLIGMTASLPSESIKVQEILVNLHSDHIEARDHFSEDVKPYIYKTDLEKIEIELPDDIRKISNLIRKTIHSYTKKLQNTGQLLPSTPSLKAVLIKTQQIEKDPILSHRWDIRGNLYSLVRLLHGLNIIETQGVYSFQKYINRLSSKNKSSGIKKLFNDSNFNEAITLNNKLQSNGDEHPKLSKLIMVLQNNLKGNDKAIVFASYRDTIDKIFDVLYKEGYHVGILIGKSGKSGQSQKQQLESLEKLKSGEYDIIVATQVGEEGLDISECKLVVFYDNVSSGIRFIQRLGRTGRKAPGKVVSFVTKGTRDETNYYLSQKRLAKTQRTVRRLTNKNSIDDKKKGLDAFL